ncbi:MAG TPA: DinB family protein, partial [Candidatus Dormibacteraeota bacterium]|nr:DinB family protein [Candidatus Dormibacteraeota bacterium]
DGRHIESELAALVIDSPANPDGSWTAKDHLAHVSWWRRRSADTLNAMRTGSEMPPVLDDDDAVNNAVIYAEIKDRGAADVRVEAEQSWLALRAAVEASSEEDLARPHPRFPEFQLWESVPSAVGHAGTHVWSWYLDIGDEERGMTAARWTADIEGRFFDTPDKLADSRYNLACVYARLGRADEALPLLRQSFEAKPELAGLARKDRDLDRIREELAPILS